MKKNRTAAENEILALRSAQSDQWVTTQEAIAEYLMLYGVHEEIAQDQATDLIDGPIDQVIADYDNGEL